ncbi:unnamed protein product [Orchesella dallaii]|uniref:SET domain-containing protein n=1 Tax=Orchesella dallaii TaxID=48710 RepID=A0ABP1R8L5_9HEXA
MDLKNIEVGGSEFINDHIIYGESVYHMLNKLLDSTDDHITNVSTAVACLKQCGEPNCKNKWSRGDNVENLLEKFDTKVMGWGVRTNGVIEKGQSVTFYWGILKIQNPCDSLYATEFNVNSKEKIYVDANAAGGLSKYFNHSCKPNVILKQVTKNNWPLLVFVAKRRIRVGEELTWNYRENYMFSECLCNSCRKEGGPEKENTKIKKRKIREDMDDPPKRHCGSQASQLPMTNHHHATFPPNVLQQSGNDDDDTTVTTQQRTRLQTRRKRKEMTGTEPGTGPGTHPGTGPGTGPGIEPGIEPGTEPGTGPGTGPGIEPGTGPGTGPGIEPGTGPGTGLESLSEPNPGKVVCTHQGCMDTFSKKGHMYRHL